MIKKSLLCCLFMLLGFTIGLPSSAHAQSSENDSVLINKSHPLRPLDYTPSSLVLPKVLLAQTDVSQEMLMVPEAARSLENLFKEARHDNDSTLVLASGYRPYEDQTVLYRVAAAKDKETADESIALPGYSEHQSGLAADVITSNYFCATEGCFALSRAAAWLHSNAYKYGFTIRYPLYKENSTGYEYEPWHLRYVGVPLAAQLHRNQETLEEFYCLP